ncbi:helix-turn-helix transcriptional regulator [Kordia sp. YSTF-M3]|uniref:Helix-turn-helix transcriptional regulator n=1 Tax=Kordia aestuariivivens TaxID=2759037 RepID=A0ABR7QB07_9FLAO|nr:helix-turn-helix transcriptional regulator [Kordia aestuariivivens]MBC8755573.1 helix-turn-helix transcriptional regulator [Kordia aestuariivivens]
MKTQYFSTKSNNPELAIKYASASLQKAIQEKNEKEENIARLLLGDAENNFGNYEVALQEINQTIAYSKKAKNKNTLIYGYKVKGSIYRNLGKYQKALEYYLKVDSFAKAEQNLLQQIKSNHDIGLIKDEMGLHADAADIFLDNLEKIKTLPSENKTTYLNIYIALVATHINLDVNKATEYNEILRKTSEAENNKTGISYYYLFKGKIACAEKNYLGALESFEKAEKLLSELKNDRNLFIVYRFQGKCFYELQYYQKAIQVLEKAKTLEVQYQFNHLERFEIVLLLAQSYEAIKADHTARENYKMAQTIMQENNVVLNAVTTRLETKFDLDYLKRKIIELEELSKKRQFYNQILIYLGILLTIILVLFLFRYRRLKTKNKEKFNKLLNYIEELEANSQQKKSTTKQQTERKISDEKAASILKALKKFETKHGYLDSKTSLTSVAKKLNTNTSYLSKIINTYKEQSFKSYITTLRINYALQKLKNDKIFCSYSIKAIALELGFKSEGSFSRAFKEHTGIYPSYFIKNITLGL